MQSAATATTFRVASSEDHGLAVELLGELVDELGPPAMAARVKPMLDADIRKALACNNIRIFIAELEGEPVGLSRADILTTDPIFRLRSDHRCGYVDQMYVRPRHRGHGVGHGLLQCCEEWLRELGIGYVLLHAAPRATSFYARNGYQPNREMFKRL